MRLSVTHTTRYTFSDPVVYGMQRLRLKPKSTHGQNLVDWAMDLDGAIAEVEYEDQNLNAAALVTILPGARELTIRCACVVDTLNNAGVIGPHVGHMPLWAFQRPTPLTQPGPKIRELVKGLDSDRANMLDTLHALSQAVLSAVTYEGGQTDARTPAETALEAGQGVCQDHAHIFIAAGRLLDIPTRYVSGYLKLDNTDQQEAGHGWAEAHVPGLGWVGFDVPNEVCPDGRYVRVATGRDYAEAAPITGLTQGSGETTLEVSVVVGQSQTQSQSAQAQQQDLTSKS
jgi:transglutaminase-like putative cysteine protease